MEEDEGEEEEEYKEEEEVEEGRKGEYGTVRKNGKEGEVNSRRYVIRNMCS